MDQRTEDTIIDEAARRNAPVRPKFGKGSMVLIGGLVAVAVLGIFIGVIIIYGGSQALTN